ncbi:methyltransferase family protein [Clostridium estertheticum]|uniref:methyltransferase family protein n=1 Tax=Clostridium estertheticum TaxID=238834 RepID=UPI001CF5D9D6|nr:isoprenylcysteine carboxylmethyltransferase family protein [Clostridium estertheticum]MCB2342439.1 isoprenylcysteine carboxylmethyltransferase family protein [Clostridium estertheticum]
MGSCVQTLNYKIGVKVLDITDATKFTNIFEYNIFLYAIGFMFLSEFIIWIFTASGNKKDRKKSDKGSIWLIILAYWLSIYVSYYLTSAEAKKIVGNLILPHICYYLGILLIIVGTIIRDYSVWTLKKAFTLSVQTTSDQHLIQKGFYRYVRNPAYTGSILSLLGIAFSLRNTFAPIIVLIICILCYGIRIKIEEKALKEQFKQEFENYYKNTYCLFPFIW